MEPGGEREKIRGRALMTEQRDVAIWGKQSHKKTTTVDADKVA